MVKRNVEGPAHSLLTDAMKHVCEFCNSSLFYIADTDSDENTDLSYDTKAWKWENSAPTLPHGNMCTLKIMCASCGKVSGKLLFCFDVCSICATPAVTATHIACVAAGIPPAGGGGANNLAGLYLTPLGGGDAGKSFLIASNTEADPTVITVSSAINNNTATEIIMISSWQVF